MAPPSSVERLRRLLALVPWVAAQDGPLIDEVCARFEIERADLLRDLEIVFVVGVHPFTPDSLVEVRVEDDRVWIDYADYFARPLRLTPDQGLALVMAARRAASLPGYSEDGPLARGVAKLAAVLGIDPEGVVDVSLGTAAEPLLEQLSDAAAVGRCVELDYYAYGRDERARRVVEPARVFVSGGEWYLAAYCRSARDDRLFRLDRIHSCAVLDERFTPSREQTPSFDLLEDNPRVTLELEPEARWVVEHYPHDEVSTREDGTLVVTLPVTARPWLERLLLRLGPAVRDADVEETFGERVVSDAARRVLDRYEKTR